MPFCPYSLFVRVGIEDIGSLFRGIVESKRRSIGVTCVCVCEVCIDDHYGSSVPHHYICQTICLVLSKPLSPIALIRPSNLFVPKANDSVIDGSVTMGNMEECLFVRFLYRFLFSSQVSVGMHRTTCWP